MTNNWQANPTDVFWVEMSPCEHLVQIYEDDSVFMDALEGFVAGGGRRHHHHRHAGASGRPGTAAPDAGMDVGAAASHDQYIALDAAETLSKFMMPLDRRSMAGKAICAAHSRVLPG